MFFTFLMIFSIFLLIPFIISIYFAIAKPFMELSDFMTFITWIGAIGLIFMVISIGIPSYQENKDVLVKFEYLNEQFCNSRFDHEVMSKEALDMNMQIIQWRENEKWYQNGLITPKRCSEINLIE